MAGSSLWPPPERTTTRYVLANCQPSIGSKRSKIILAGLRPQGADADRELWVLPGGTVAVMRPLNPTTVLVDGAGDTSQRVRALALDCHEKRPGDTRRSMSVPRASACPFVGHEPEIRATGDPQREGAAPGHVEAVQIAGVDPAVDPARTFALLPMKTPGAVSSPARRCHANRYRCLSRAAGH